MGVWSHCVKFYLVRDLWCGRPCWEGGTRVGRLDCTRDRAFLRIDSDVFARLRGQGLSANSGLCSASVEGKQNSEAHCSVPCLSAHWGTTSPDSGVGKWLRLCLSCGKGSGLGTWFTVSNPGWPLTPWVAVDSLVLILLPPVLVLQVCATISCLYYAGDGTQGLMHIRHVLYQLSYLPVPLFLLEPFIY